MTTAPVPESRIYRHLKCGGDTTVSGDSFEFASNPFSNMSHTWCATCNGFFRVAEYEWSDTREKITDYYARHGSRATPFQRFVCSRSIGIIGMIIGLVLGLVTGNFLFLNQAQGTRILLTLFAGFVGIMICVMSQTELRKLIARRVCGVSDSRMLT
ncbi:MAG: hypothetical protein JWN70_4480 [Planctomycetaceae bacterium]|nr:hypothetical protein [Planctomycetaceae bacterium]